MAGYWIPRLTLTSPVGHPVMGVPNNARLIHQDAYFYASMIRASGYAIDGALVGVVNIVVDLLALVGVAVCVLVLFDVLRHKRRGGSSRDYADHLRRRWDGLAGTATAARFWRLMQPEPPDSESAEVKH